MFSKKIILSILMLSTLCINTVKAIDFNISDETKSVLLSFGIGLAHGITNNLIDHAIDSHQSEIKYVDGTGKVIARSKPSKLTLHGITLLGFSQNAHKELARHMGHDLSVARSIAYKAMTSNNKDEIDPLVKTFSAKKYISLKDEKNLFAHGRCISLVKKSQAYSIASFLK